MIQKQSHDAIYHVVSVLRLVISLWLIRNEPQFGFSIPADITVLKRECVVLTLQLCNRHCHCT